MAKTSVNVTAIPADEMKQLVTVRLPRATGSEDDTLFVSLNGKGFNIKRGVPVRVPKPVAAIIRESERQQDRLAAFDAAQAELARNGH